jgi:hypothetical protein
VVQIRTRLNQCRKKNKSGQVYLDEIKGLSDEMAAAGKPLDNLDVISHILSGLDEEYDGFVAAITALIKAEKNVSLSDVYSQFMSYEAQMESRKSMDGSSVNSATRGGRGHGDYQDQYHDRQYDYDQRNGYGGGYDRQNYGGGRGGYGGGRGNGGRNPQGNRQNYGNGGRTNETCQIYGKTGHTALNCLKRHQKNYRGPEKICWRRLWILWS